MAQLWYQLLSWNARTQKHTKNRQKPWQKCNNLSSGSPTQYTNPSFGLNAKQILQQILPLSKWPIDCCALWLTHTHIYAHSGANKHSKTHIALMKRNIFETMLIANDANRSCIERSICNQIIRRNFYSPCTEKNILCYRTNINIQWSINKSPNS